MQLVGPAQEFYSAALLYLSYTSVDELSAEEKYVLATDMALAAITGDDIFNFGEVIATPILSFLKNTPNAWLNDLVHALHSGNIDQYNVIVDSCRVQYSAQPSLAGRHEVIKQKLVLLSLVNLAFERPSQARLVSFTDIANRTKIPVDQVHISSCCMYVVVSSFCARWNGC